jgi:N-acylneuraminate cytidylyltransferase
VNIAIIPARGGSKRIPRKNIKEFCGQPMISYAIAAAKESGLFDRIIVSTDDEEIACISNKWGAETPFYRPVELANDYTATAPVIAHAIEACQNLGWKFDNVCCIYPCVPFIKITDLVGALALMHNSELNYCFPVTEYPSSIQQALKLSNDFKTKPFYPEYEIKRTQDLEPAYYDAGQFYWGAKDLWLTNPNIHSSGLGYLIPNWRVVDIDTPEDLLRAELIYRSILNSNATI